MIKYIGLSLLAVALSLFLVGAGSDPVLGDHRGGPPIPEYCLEAERIFNETGSSRIRCDHFAFDDGRFPAGVTNSTFKVKLSDLFRGEFEWIYVLVLDPSGITKLINGGENAIDAQQLHSFLKYAFDNGSHGGRLLGTPKDIFMFEENYGVPYNENPFVHYEYFIYNPAPASAGQSETFGYRVTIPSGISHTSGALFSNERRDLGNFTSGTSDTGYITFRNEELICDTRLGSGADFGDLRVGATSKSDLIPVSNVGNLDSVIDILGQDWVSADNSIPVMKVEQTRWSLEPLTSGNRGNPLTEEKKTFSTFTLPVGDNRDIYLQLDVDLLDDLFRGPITQTISIVSDCKDTIDEIYGRP